MVSENKSKGSLGFYGRMEYFLGEDGSLYEAPWCNPIDIWGYRQGARWECYAWHVEISMAQVRANYPEVTVVPV